MKIIVALLIFLQLPPILIPQSKQSGSPQVVTLPRGPVTRISSPDTKWTLVFECPNNCSQRKLSIEDNRTHVSRLIKEYERSLEIGWAPDSRHFFVNDASGSTETKAYVYDPFTLKETALAKVLVASAPSTDEYLGAGHSYLEVKRWVNPHEMLVCLWGHFDQERRGFTLRYRVDLSSGGSVQRVHRRVDKER